MKKITQINISINLSLLLGFYFFINNSFSYPSSLDNKYVLQRAINQEKKHLAVIKQLFEPGNKCYSADCLVIDKNLPALSNIDNPFVPKKEKIITDSVTAFLQKDWYVQGYVKKYQQPITHLFISAARDSGQVIDLALNQLLFDQKWQIIGLSTKKIRLFNRKSHQTITLNCHN